MDGMCMSLSQKNCNSQDQAVDMYVKRADLSLPFQLQFTVCIRKNNQTIYQQVLSSRKPKNKHLSSSWKWGFPGSQASYTGLYPRAWTVYEIPEHQIKLVCRQITPIIPGDYKVGTVYICFQWLLGFQKGL